MFYTEQIWKFCLFFLFSILSTLLVTGMSLPRLTFVYKLWLKVLQSVCFLPTSNFYYSLSCFYFLVNKERDYQQSF